MPADDSEGHPPASADTARFPSSSPAITTIEKQGFLKLLNSSRLANAAAPSLSGWTGELVKSLAQDETCVNALNALVVDIINGRFCTSPFKQVRIRLLASKETPIIKSSSDPSKVRPIAIGETFVRLAGLCVLDMLQPKMKLLFPSIQYGVGVRSGCEQVIHSTRAALEAYGPDSIALSLDQQNAFNERRRELIRSALYSSPHADIARRFFHFAYAESSLLCLYDQHRDIKHVLESAQGVRQGDTMASFYYALSMQNLYVQATAVVPPKSVAAFAILDDFTIVGHYDNVIKVFDEFCRLATPEGIILQPSKSQIIWPETRSDPPPSSLQSLASSRQLPIVRSAVLLGSLIGATNSNTSSWISAEIAASNTFFSALLHETMKKQIILPLLRNLLPRFHYLLRTNSPTNSLAACQSISASTREVIAHLAGIKPAELTSQALTQASLPRSAGGLSIRDPTRHATAAWLASIITAIPNIRNVFANVNVHESFKSHSLIAADLKTAHTFITAETDIIPNSDPDSALPFPSNFKQFFSLFNHSQPLHYEKALSTALTKHQSNLLESADIVTRARLQSLSNKNAMNVLDLIPTHADFIIPNHHITLLVQLTLGILPSDAPSKCLCGSTITSLDHLLFCQALHRKSRISHWVATHNRILRAIAPFVRQVADIEIEPKSYKSRIDLFEAKVPDAAIFGSYPFGHKLLDVSVTCPTATSLRVAASTTRLSAATAREKTKFAKYRSLAEQHSAQSVPFVMESFGAYGTHARHFIRDLVTLYINKNGIDASSFRSNFITATSLALVRGNINTITNLLTLIRSKWQLAPPIPPVPFPPIPSHLARSPPPPPRITVSISNSPERANPIPRPRASQFFRASPLRPLIL